VEAWHIQYNQPREVCLWWQNCIYSTKMWRW